METVKEEVTHESKSKEKISHDNVSPRFSNGKHAGESVERLSDKLVIGDVFLDFVLISGRTVGSLAVEPSLRVHQLRFLTMT